MRLRLTLVPPFRVTAFALTGTGGQVSPLVAPALSGPTERDRARPSARARATRVAIPTANNRPTRRRGVLAMPSP